MKFNQNVVSIISLCISVIAVPLSAYLSYYYTKKSFLEQRRIENAYLIYTDLQDFIRISENYNSLLSTAITQLLAIKNEDFNKPESKTIFEKNSDIVFDELVNTGILTNIEYNMDNLFKNEFFNVIRKDDKIYDKLVSLYYSIKSEKKSSNEKLRLYKYITFDNNLTEELREFNFWIIKKRIKGYYESINHR